MGAAFKRSVLGCMLAASLAAAKGTHGRQWTWSMARLVRLLALLLGVRPIGGVAVPTSTGDQQPPHQGGVMAGMAFVFSVVTMLSLVTVNAIGTPKGMRAHYSRVLRDDRTGGDGQEEATPAVARGSEARGVRLGAANGRRDDGRSHRTGQGPTGAGREPGRTPLLADCVAAAVVRLVAKAGRGRHLRVGSLRESGRGGRGRRQRVPGEEPARIIPVDVMRCRAEGEALLRQAAQRHAEHRALRPCTVQPRRREPPQQAGTDGDARGADGLDRGQRRQNKRARHAEVPEIEDGGYRSVADGEGSGMGGEGGEHGRTLRNSQDLRHKLRDMKAGAGAAERNGGGGGGEGEATGAATGTAGGTATTPPAAVATEVATRLVSARSPMGAAKATPPPAEALAATGAQVGPMPGGYGCHPPTSPLRPDRARRLPDQARGSAAVVYAGPLHVQLLPKGSSPTGRQQWRPPCRQQLPPGAECGPPQEPVQAGLPDHDEAPAAEPGLTEETDGETTMGCPRGPRAKGGKADDTRACVVRWGRRAVATTDTDQRTGQGQPLTRPAAGVLHATTMSLGEGSTGVNTQAAAPSAGTRGTKATGAELRPLAPAEETLSPAGEQYPRSLCRQGLTPGSGVATAQETRSTGVPATIHPLTEGADRAEAPEAGTAQACTMGPKATDGGGTATERRRGDRNDLPWRRRRRTRRRGRHGPCRAGVRGYNVPQQWLRRRRLSARWKRTRRRRRTRGRMNFISSPGMTNCT